MQVSPAVPRDRHWQITTRVCFIEYASCSDAISARVPTRHGHAVMGAGEANIVIIARRSSATSRRVLPVLVERWMLQTTLRQRIGRPQASSLSRSLAEEFHRRYHRGELMRPNDLTPMKGVKRGDAGLDWF